jgi:hypothetical protein
MLIRFGNSNLVEMAALRWHTFLLGNAAGERHSPAGLSRLFRTAAENAAAYHDADPAI